VIQWRQKRRICHRDLDHDYSIPMFPRDTRRGRRTQCDSRALDITAESAKEEYILL
jgi:hypothetical protein